MRKLILTLILVFATVTPCFAAKWLALPATDMCSVAPANNAFGVTYSWHNHVCGNYIEAYSGGVWDDANRTFYIWGGGHGDYAGNEIYKIDISLTSGVNVSRYTDPTIADPAWAPTYYTAAQYISTVLHGGTTYVCILDHISGASTEPGVGADWATYWITSSGGTVDWVTATKYISLGTVPGTNDPASRHTYNNIVFVPAAQSGLAHDMLWSWGGKIYSGGGGEEHNLYMFDFTTKTWTRKIPSGTGPGWGSFVFAQFDPISHKVWAIDNNTGAWNSYLFSYDLQTDTWDRHTFSPGLSTGNYAARTATMVGSDFYFMGGGGIWKVSTIGSPDWQWHVVSTSDTNGGVDKAAIEGAVCPGVVYDSKRGTIIAFDGVTNASAQNVYSLNLSTFIWSKTTVSTNAPTVIPQNGTYGRFSYSTKMDCYVFVPNASNNVYLFCPDDYPTDLWFSRTLSGVSRSNDCEGGGCKHIRMGQVPGSNEIWFFGGDHGPGSAQSDIYTYNVDTDVWTQKMPPCATDGTPQLDGLDQGGLFYNTNNNKFYYWYAGNYCSQRRDNATCVNPNTYNPSGAYGSCANSAMVNQVNIGFNVASNAWETGAQFASHPTLGGLWWLAYDATLNKAVHFTSGNRTALSRRLYDLPPIDTWTSTKTLISPIDDGNTIYEGFWGHDKVNRIIYIWNYFYHATYNPTGKIYAYNINADTATTISTEAPSITGSNQLQTQWDSANNILFLFENYDAQSYPLKVNTFTPNSVSNPTSGTWQKNLSYNSWNAKNPFGRESFYDATHNLHILLGSDEGVYKTNQIWFYRYGGGAGAGEGGVGTTLGPGISFSGGTMF